MKHLLQPFRASAFVLGSVAAKLQVFHDRHGREQGPPLLHMIISDNRFDEDYAYAISDEAFLFAKIRPCRNLVSHILLSLTAETSSYVEELLSILRSLTWEARGRLTPIDALEEVAIRRRMRELLVLLKGNDVWLHFYDNFRTLPESGEVPPESTRCEHEFQAVVAFGPPGEYGEITIKVPIDRGQPWVFAE